MKNSEVVNAFFRGIDAHNANMESINDKLFSYYTIIAEITYIDGKRCLIINRTKYSVTTSAKHQNPLFKQAEREGYRFDKVINVNNVPINAKTLGRYIK